MNKDWQRQVEMRLFSPVFDAKKLPSDMNMNFLLFSKIWRKYSFFLQTNTIHFFQVT
jgi:hypothetical protein